MSVKGHNSGCLKLVLLKPCKIFFLFFFCMCLLYGEILRKPEWLEFGGSAVVKAYTMTLFAVKWGALLVLVLGKEKCKDVFCKSGYTLFITKCHKVAILATLLEVAKP